MSKKLSQSEIDALVASLLSGDAPAAEPEAQAGAPAQPQEAAIVEPAPAVAAPAAAPSPAILNTAPAAAPVIGLTPENMPFELQQDLGPITQAEVDQAIRIHAGASPSAVAQVAPAPAPTPMPAAAPQPAAPAAAIATPAPHVAMPPSNASYAASQAQAAQQTRRALSMAALRGVLMDIELTVTVELGKAKLNLSEVLNLGPGSVVTLDKPANVPVDVLVNRVPLMKADVLAIGEKYGVRITEANLAGRGKAAS